MQNLMRHVLFASCEIVNMYQAKYSREYHKMIAYYIL